MDKWKDMINSFKEDQDRFDQNSFAEALKVLFELNSNLKDLREEATQHAPTIQRCFEDVDMPLNNIQLATATLAYLNTRRFQHQIYVVPAGQGKSRIHAAITFSILKNTNQNVYVAFANEGLMKRDRDQIEAMFGYFGGRGLRPAQRVHYQVGIEFKKKLTSGFLIIDESDDLMFTDFESFY